MGDDSSETAPGLGGRFTPFAADEDPRRQQLVRRAETSRASELKLLLRAPHQ
jgi:hypothetical protein